MEGPSLKILETELQPFVGQVVAAASGGAKLDFAKFVGKRLAEVRTWGKHLLLRIGRTWLRVHFLMFGSYRIDAEREGREPKLALVFRNDHTFNIYSSAVGVLELTPDELYDWRLDVMDERWDSSLAKKQLRSKPEVQVCDALMDQDIFAGVGNIIKNEVLFALRLNPKAKVATLTPARLSKLVAETVEYCQKFRRWKEQGQLKRNWQVFRKKTCPRCKGPVTKAATGRLLRLSHFCPVCQPL